MRHKMGLMILALALVAAMALPPAQPAYALPRLDEIPADALYVPGEIVVSFPAGLSKSTYKSKASALARTVGAQVVRSYYNLALFSFDPETDVEALALQLQSGGLAEIAQPNYIYGIPEKMGNSLGTLVQTEGYNLTDATGNNLQIPWDELALMRSYRKSGGKTKATPTFPNELPTGIHWGWDKIQADLMWSNTNASAYVCLLDTGVDYRHPDLKGYISNGYDFINYDSNPSDDNGHGTHLAGIITAKWNNGADTAIGVSNGKVKSVKVLNAQGLGTSYSVSAGILYCRSSTSYKVINMSFGSPAQDRLMYESMTKALESGKLMVAAAGNETGSAPLYPAAWGYSRTPAPSGGDSGIHNGLISVGGGGAPSAYPIWVDSNGNRGIESNELYASEQCASGFPGDVEASGTNYGNWVELVAPGESIYSTTPYNQPFYGNYYEGVSPNYDSLSGTSMATAYVSAAAVRYWSVNTTASAMMVHDGLISPEGSDALDFAVDTGNQHPEFDPANGYNNPAYYGDVTYGEPFDSDFDGTPDTIMAPYCWSGWESGPPPAGGWGDQQNMKYKEGGLESRYLNVAKAMNRTAMMVEVKDAGTGLPLEKAYVYVYDVSGSTPVLRDKAVTVAGVSRVLMINIPLAATPTDLSVRVNKSGYTSTTYEINRLEDWQVDKAGEMQADPYNKVSLATKSYVQFVLDWQNPYEMSEIMPEDPNLDMFLWLPEAPPNQNDDFGAIVGPENGRLMWYDGDDTNRDLADEFIGMGTLLDPSAFLPPGSALTFYAPYATHLFDGGVAAYDDQGYLLSPEELISAKPYKSNKYSPYAIMKIEGQYTLMVTDYSEPDLYNLPMPDPPPTDFLDTEVNNEDFTFPVVRVWSYGKLVDTIKLIDCEEPNDWWKVLTMDVTLDAKGLPVTTTLTPVNACLKGRDGAANNLPYGLDD
ncbi:MAG: S8 family serine peptidase [Anaerolineae bacterium]|nr:S8 family serine peptidase [Anaerolineae bacterium]